MYTNNDSAYVYRQDRAVGNQSHQGLSYDGISITWTHLRPPSRERSNEDLDRRTCEREQREERYRMARSDVLDALATKLTEWPACDLTRCM